MSEFASNISKNTDLKDFPKEMTETAAIGHYQDAYVRLRILRTYPLEYLQRDFPTLSFEELENLGAKAQGRIGWFLYSNNIDPSRVLQGFPGSILITKKVRFGMVQKEDDGSEFGE